MGDGRLERLSPPWFRFKSTPPLPHTFLPTPFLFFKWSSPDNVYEGSNIWVLTVRQTAEINFSALAPDADYNEYFILFVFIIKLGCRNL